MGAYVARTEEWARSPVPDLTNWLNQLAIPVLLIWATHDPLRPLPWRTALQRRYLQPPSTTFPSDDHWVVQRFADQSATAVQAFITQSGDCHCSAGLWSPEATTKPGNCRN